MKKSLTLIERAIATVNPRAAFNRYRYRQVLNHASGGGYTGASTTRRPTKRWLTRESSVNADLLPDAAGLRTRSRDLARNAALAAGAVNTVVTNVVGTGLRVIPEIDRQFLGLTDEQADDWERAAVREFNRWAKRADIGKRQNFDGLQDLILRSVLLSGDVLVVRRFREDPKTGFGFKLQVVEADRVSNPNGQADTTEVMAGVEIDSDSAPKAYHVADRHPHEIATRAGARKWARVPAEDKAGDWQALLCFKPERPDQIRGVPYLAPVIEAIKQLSRYTEAEIEAAVISSFFTVFIKSETGDGLGEFEPDAEVADTTDDGDYKLGSGTMVDLLPGEDISTANPGRPNSLFDPFIQAILRQVGTALEIPFELLIKHFTKSYSAARAAMLEAWKAFRTRRKWLADTLCALVYEAVISESIARARLEAPGFFADPAIREAYLGASWVGPAAGQLDPDKEIKAATSAVQLGVRTRREIAAEMYGSDWDQVNRQLNRENEAMGDKADLSPQPADLSPPEGDLSPSEERISPLDDEDIDPDEIDPEEIEEREE